MHRKTSKELEILSNRKLLRRCVIRKISKAKQAYLLRFPSEAPPPFLRSDATAKEDLDQHHHGRNGYSNPQSEAWSTNSRGETSCFIVHSRRNYSKGESEFDWWWWWRLQTSLGPATLGRAEATAKVWIDRRAEVRGDGGQSSGRSCDSGGRDREWAGKKMGGEREDSHEGPFKSPTRCLNNLR
ncbi:hypothetical protein NL676_007370 [Syzygium grande]|nr:hypothetical protein NL676_007370 [Syzygium grande]